MTKLTEPVCGGFVEMIVSSAHPPALCSFTKWGYVMNINFATAMVLPFAFGAASMASAATVVAPCDVNLVASATDCSGYYDGNLLGGSADKIADQKTAIDSLSSNFVFNGNWAAVDRTKVLTLTGPNADLIDFGQTLFGETIIGIHFGNVAGPAGNVTGFYLLDFGSTGSQTIQLNSPGGFSNAVLFTTSAVPEPGTWLLMILGFGLLASAMRRKKAATVRSVTVNFA